jgi:hypothetical protein
MGSIMLLAGLSLALSALSPVFATLLAQTPSPHPTSLQTSNLLLSSESLASAAIPRLDLPAGSALEALPEAPIPAAAAMASEAAAISAGPALFSAPCRTESARSSGPAADSADGAREPCLESPNPYSRFLNNTVPVPLSPEQKARLALHNLKDPGNLATILGNAGYTIATNSHTAYGPGWKGFGRDSGYSLLQDATGEFFGTFLVPSLTHEDPHYHRMPNATIPRRIVHAVARTVIAQSDTGRPMPNFSTLLGYPICDEIGNLYVPGVHGNGPSTVARIMTGYATDPIDNLITEFLPDVAKRIHVRVLFVQRILNPVASDQYSLP